MNNMRKINVVYLNELRINIRQHFKRGTNFNLPI